MLACQRNSRYLSVALRCRSPSRQAANKHSLLNLEFMYFGL